MLLWARVSTVPFARVGAGAEARPAPLIPASCSMHRVKLRSGIPGGSCFSCPSAPGSRGWRGRDFPSTSSHTHPPSGFGRAPTVAPWSIAPTRDPACRAQAAAAHRPRGRTDRQTGRQQFPQPAPGRRRCRPPDAEPLGATNHDSPPPPLSTGQGTDARPGSGCCASSRAPEPTLQLSRGVCRIRCMQSTCAFQREHPRSYSIYPLAPILPKTTPC